MILRHTSRSSMGLDFADLDRDGHDDFLVVDMLARDHGKRMMQLVIAGRSSPSPPRSLRSKTANFLSGDPEFEPLEKEIKINWLK